MQIVVALMGGLLLASAPNLNHPSPMDHGKLIGTVTNTRAETIPDARVKAIDITNSKNTFEATASNGVFSLMVPPGYYCLEVSTGEYQTIRSKAVRVAASDTAIVDVQLPNRTSWLESPPAALWTLFGLLLTIIIQLIWPHLWSWWNRPQLKVEAKPTKPYSHKFQRQFLPATTNLQVGQTLGGESRGSFAGAIVFYFTRIKVTNKGNRNEAEDVDIFINHIGEINGEEVRDLDHFIPANLRWSNTWDIAEAALDKAGVSEVLVKRRISARGGHRFCDLGFILDPEQLADFCQTTSVGKRDKTILPSNGEVLFILATDYIRPWIPRSLSPGTYWLELLCDAKQMKPRLFWLRVTVPQVFVPQSDSGGIEICCSNERPPQLRSWRPDNLGKRFSMQRSRAQ